MFRWLFGAKQAKAGKRRQGSREERQKRIKKGIVQLEATLQGEISPSYKEFLLNYEQVDYLDKTCDVYADSQAQDRVLYNFIIKKFLSINPSGSEDLIKNHQNYKDVLPRPGLLPIAFDQFRNIMCLDMQDGSIHFWDVQNAVETRHLEAGQASHRVFFVAPTFLDFKDRLYRVSRYT